MPSDATTWTLRAQTDDDTPDIAHLLIRVDAAWHDEPFRQAVRDGGLNAALNIVSKPRIAGIVAISDNTLIGAAALRHVDGHVHLSNVMVDPAHEGQGIGRALVTAMCHHAATLGADLYLDVLDSSQRARHLYQSLGFRPIATTRGTITGRPGTLMKLEHTRA